MPLYPAESLLGGVSRQPETVRLPTQVQESINMIPDVSRGLTKRPTEDIIQEIASGITENTYTQFFEDSDGTHYFMRIDDMTGGGTDPVRIWNLDRGAETVVDIPVDASTTEAYFEVATESTPRDAFRTATSADTTMIVNNGIVIANNSVSLSPNSLDHCGLFVKVEQANSIYSASVTWTSNDYPSGHTETRSITSDISTSTSRGPKPIAIKLEAAFTEVLADSEVTMTVTQGVLFFELNTTVSAVATIVCEVTQDPLGDDKGFVAINKSVSEFTDLPTTWGTGFPIKVTGTDSNDFVQYFVQYIGEGIWREDQDRAFGNPAVAMSYGTLPARLVLDRSDFTVGRGFAFILEQVTATNPVYASRVVGDTETSPDPSFVGKTIADVFFYKNRLGFLSDENVILSELGAPFNFFPTTVLDVLDTDPIDVSADSAAVNILKRAVVTDDTLTVFSKDAQFNLKGFTPNTAALTYLSGYESDTDVKPVTTARSILFSSPDTDVSSRVLEFQRLDTDVFTADDTTIHIPDYIVGRLSGMASHTASRTTLCWTNETDTGIIYVNNVLWQDNSKVQNAWHKWKLNATGTPLNHIMGCHFFDDDIFVALRNTSTNAVIIVKLDKSTGLNEPLLSYRYKLDMRLLDTDLTITPAGNAYSFVYPHCSETVPPKIIRHDPSTGETRELDILSISGTTVTIAESGDFIIGMVPEFSVTPSRPVLKDQNGKAILHFLNQQQLTHLWVYHDKTFKYTSVLVGEGRDDSVESFSAQVSQQAQYNIVPLSTDAIEIQIGRSFSELDLTLTSNNAFPATFVNIEWHVEAGSTKG